MKKYIFTICLFLLLPVVLFAQLTPQTNRMVDTKALDIMKGLVAEISRHATLKMVFEVKYKNSKGSVIRSDEGELLMKGSAYKGRLQGNEIYCNGKETWLYQKEINEVQWQTYDAQSEDILNVSKFLSENEKHFRSRFIKEETKNQEVFQTVDLLPIKSMNYHKIRIVLQKRKRQILSLTIHQKNGESVCYEVKRWLSDIPADDSEFTFDAKAHPAVEIIDLR